MDCFLCSLNAVNGKPACADDWLINEVARHDWGFEGYVTTDWSGHKQSLLDQSSAGKLF